MQRLWKYVFTNYNEQWIVKWKTQEEKQNEIQNIVICIYSEWFIEPHKLYIQNSSAHLPITYEK